MTTKAEFTRIMKELERIHKLALEIAREYKNPSALYDLRESVSDEISNAFSELDHLDDVAERIPTMPSYRNKGYQLEKLHTLMEYRKKINKEIESVEKANKG